MEIIHQPKDISIFCKRVPTFPTGIKEAFDALSKSVNGPKGRDFYGISYMEKGQIVYKAAVSALENEQASQYDCEAFTISKGDYLGKTLHEWMSKTDQIKDVFMELMQDKRMDQTYPCIEWYKTDLEMICMVKMGH